MSPPNCSTSILHPIWFATTTTTSWKYHCVFSLLCNFCAPLKMSNFYESCWCRFNQKQSCCINKADLGNNKMTYSAKMLFPIFLFFFFITSARAKALMSWNQPKVQQFSMCDTPHKVNVAVASLWYCMMLSLEISIWLNIFGRQHPMNQLMHWVDKWKYSELTTTLLPPSPLIKNSFQIKYILKRVS